MNQAFLRIFNNPRHPYTMGLLACVPRLDEDTGRRLMPIEGTPPTLIDMPPTCAFLNRCPYSANICERNPWPEPREIGMQHYVSCIRVN